MDIKVLEHNGIYTAYRLTRKRRDDGSLYESVTPIKIPIPSPKGGWTAWASQLDCDQLEVALQIYFDRWNFGRLDKNGTGVILNILYEERELREELERATLKAYEAANMGSP